MKTKVSVKERLRRQPYKFTFYQAVRLLLSAFPKGSDTSAEPSTLRPEDAGSTSLTDTPQRQRRGRIGTISNINEEPVRFQVQPALRFAPSEVLSVTPHDSGEQSSADGDAASGGLIDMQVSFWGLTGPAGALPTHYTQMVIDRVHAKDHAMRSFFDMFSHRQLSFFFRSWEKYSLAVGYETAQYDSRPEADLIRETLLAIVGRGTQKTRDRLHVTDDALIYYGGVFNDRPTAESLRAIVSDYLDLPAKVISLFGQWLVLPPNECSRLGTLGGHSIVGTDTILGGRTWDPGSKFRIQIGPVKLEDFTRLMPTGNTLAQTCQFIRSYVGMEFDFDLQVILLASEIPACQLAPSAPQLPSEQKPSKQKPHQLSGGQGSGSQQSPNQTSPHLGWNTWLCSHQPTSNSDAAVFQHDGAPIH